MNQPSVCYTNTDGSGTQAKASASNAAT